MKRKVIQQGPATLMVSLPSKWVKSQGIKKGDEIEMTDDGQSLVIGVPRSRRLTSINIILHGADTYLKESILRPYEAGFDEIIVEYDDPLIINKIRSDLEFFLGFEIVEQGSRHCILKNIAEESTDDLSRYINRAYMSLISLAKESLELLEKRDYMHLNELGNTHKLTQKFSHLCLRILNKKGLQLGTPPMGSSLYSITKIYTLLAQLIPIGDEISRICVDTAKIRARSFNPSSIQFFRRIVQLIEKSYNLYGDHPSHQDFYIVKAELRESKALGIAALKRGAFHDLVLVRRVFAIRMLLYPTMENIYWPQTKVTQ
jgi:phosphate uptake regulator